MLRKLDRHFFASAFVPYLFSVSACIGLFLVIDILSGMGRISRATSAGTPPMDIVVYYLVRLPGMFVSTFPFTHSLAITFAALSVIRRREGAISMSAGISMRRVLAPLLAAGVLAVCVYFACANFAVPALKSAELEVDAALFAKTSDLSNAVAVLRDGEKTTVYRLEKLTRVGGRISATGFNCYISPHDGTFSEIWADSAERDPKGGAWILKGGHKADYDKEGQRTLTEVTRCESSLREAEYFTSLGPDALSLMDLVSLRRSARFSYELHKRFAVACALVLLGLVLVAVASRSRGSMYFALGGTLMIVFCYYVCDFLLGTSTDFLSPALAAWALPALVASVGSYSFVHMPT